MNWLKAFREITIRMNTIQLPKNSAAIMFGCSWRGFRLPRQATPLLEAP